MATSQFSLSWKSHMKNICTGLSALQQNGEFVDMTLAADGHLVKVHQVVLALASPYIKDLISSAQCPHPVIFINKVSFNTLSAILEYIYTGEVSISIHNLKDVMEAAKELHIEGLKDMKLQETLTKTKMEYNEEDTKEETFDTYTTVIQGVESNMYYEITNATDENRADSANNDNTITGDVTIEEEGPLYEETEQTRGNMTLMELPVQQTVCIEADTQNITSLQYTVSNRGSLQMILNRFMYYLKHTNRDRSRQWRCVDYLNNFKCPAYVVTKGDVVVQRISAHSHPFHDKKILKKINAGAIFSAINDAELEGKTKRNNTQAMKNMDSE